MQSKIDFLWSQFKIKVKKYHIIVDKAPIALMEKNTTVEDYESGRAAFQKWQIEMRKIRLEVWAWFGILFIELDNFYQNHISEDDRQNFALKEISFVHMKEWDKKGKRAEQKVEITKIRKMINFLRHTFCHPEETSGLRIDPAIADILMTPPNKLGSSYHEFIIEKNNGNIYLRVGGGKLYFSELENAIKLAK